MKKITICAALALAVVLTACGQGKSNDVTIEYGSSEIYKKQTLMRL